MLDVTSYADNLPATLNTVLTEFAGGRCVMVRKLRKKDNFSVKSKSGNCHVNVRMFIDEYGGSSISGWLLNRVPKLLEMGMYVWSFHSVWQKPDEKWLDVTDDKYYVGRDKSIFTPDCKRYPDLIEGISYNNFLVITDPAFAEHYGNSIGRRIEPNTPYWCDSAMIRLLSIEEHMGAYRLLGADYPGNEKRLSDEYEVEFVNGQLIPKAGSKYEKSLEFPIKMVFDYSISTRG